MTKFKIRLALTSSLLLATCLTFSQTKATPKDKFVSELIAKMTLDEKLGQLNLPGADDILTGQAQSSNIAKNCVFNFIIHLTNKLVSYS